LRDFHFFILPGPLHEQKSIRRNSRGFDYFPLSTGISGILWTLVHLNNEKFIDADCSFEELQPILEKQMLLFAQASNFDYLHGAMGFCLYLLSNPSPDLVSVLKQFVQLLKEKGIAEKDTIKWPHQLSNDPSRTTFGISLSHGLSSTLILLTKILKTDPGNLLVSDLLKKAAAYLLSQKNDPSQNLLSVYPSFGETDTNFRESRLAWCYGDLGISVALYETGLSLNDQHLMEEAIHTMVQASKRRDLKANSVADAGLCHGTAGVAHIFNRFYQQTKINIFKEAAVYWFEKTMDITPLTDGNEKYPSKSEHDWMSDSGFLEGTAGVGLALISAVSDVEPKWDAALLLS
jgi:lantibiotic modifying enzyme